MTRSTRSLEQYCLGCRKTWQRWIAAPHRDWVRTKRLLELTLMWIYTYPAGSVNVETMVSIGRKEVAVTLNVCVTGSGTDMAVIVMADRVVVEMKLIVNVLLDMRVCS